jgi:hypothetical protein
VWIGGYDQWPEIEHRVNVKGFIWIPSLSQWLGMIEAKLKSPMLAMGVYYNEEKEPRYRAWCDDIQHWIGEELGAQCWEIAAASLWWRLREVE